jgi:DNA-binding GntR family transcriptional regulator
MEQPLTRTMGAQITARIRERILSGAYAPGAALLQDVIAAEFGTSKIPVREALVQLRSEGLLDIYAHRGFQVRPLSAQELSELFQLRLHLEPRAVAEGARLATAADRAAAGSALEALNGALAASELTHSGDLNCAFHLALIVPRLQPVAADILYRLHTLSQRYIRLHLQPAGRVRRANREHAALYRAWTAGTARAVQQLARAHIEETRAELAAVLAARPPARRVHAAPRPPSRAERGPA